MRFLHLAILSLTCVAPLSESRADQLVDASATFPTATDWPWWRGPHRNGIAAPDQSLPMDWSAKETVLWKSPVVGRGWGSPTVVGNQIFLATADEVQETQSVVCYDRRDGRLLWTTVVHQGGLLTKDLNAKASHASSTIACDGELLFITLANGDAVYATALNRAGQEVWQSKISDYVLYQGYAASPAVYGPLVIVASDNKGGGAVAGLERTTGKIVWRNDRPQKPNYTSPIILRVRDRDQVLMTGCDVVSSFDPLTGDKLWEFSGSTTECVTSIVTDGERIFTTGGYPKNHVAAFSGDGSGTVVWEKNDRVYVPSLLAHDGHLYAVMDAGVATCWNATTGDKVWSGRLAGTFSASPVLVGSSILAINEEGQAFVFKATPQAFELVAQNQLGDEAFATPTVCGNRIYARVAHNEGEARQEMLYCLGDAE